MMAFTEEGSVPQCANEQMTVNALNAVYDQLHAADV